MNADIRIENGKLIYGLEECFCDTNGTIPGSKPCSKCNGTGRTKGGLGKGDCRQCHGFKTQIDHEHRVPCTWGCNGTHYKQANSCSYLPDSIFPSLAFKVYRSDRPQTIAESLLGVGVFSCTDYGRHAQQTDTALIDSVKAHGSVQATKISKEDGTICDHVGIFCNRNGYTVEAVYA